MADCQVAPDDVDKFSGAMRDLAGQADAAGNHVTKWYNLTRASGSPLRAARSRDSYRLRPIRLSVDRA